MGKFNKVKTFTLPSTTTVNAERGIAFKVNPKLELTLRVATCLINEPKFYDPACRGDSEIKQLIAKVAVTDPEYILKLAAYVRSELYLRSVATFILVEALQYQQCKKYVRKYMPLILIRPDDTTEAVAYFIAKNGNIGSEGKASMPHCFRDGLLICLRKFGAYGIAKYKKGNKKEVTFKDILRLLHPTPMDSKEEKLFKDIINDTLPVPETWETYISANGSNKESWEHIVPKMGIFALTRNLRNILQKKVNAYTINVAISTLTNKEEIRKSKMLPFRFLSAYKEVEKLSDVDPFAKKELLKALNTAISLSISNIPKLTGRTMILNDRSGSMSSRTVSTMSDVYCNDIASTMGAMAYYISNNPVIGVFGTEFALVDIENMGILEAAKKLSTVRVGDCTYAYKAMQYLIDNRVNVDRIILFSDEQLYNPHDSNYMTEVSQTLYHQLRRYKKLVNSNVKFYSIDLHGYGTSPFPEGMKGVVLLAGWSDKIFQLIQTIEAVNSNAELIN